MPAGQARNAKYEIQRFKGLGEMIPQQFRNTTINPRQIWTFKSCPSADELK
ncbi:hypothetical protein H6F87_23185 [Cyanobacteria bacterium FACHB-502]|nr:hypothetical protein [Cyanobacteria bacterium FACHB-502]